MNLPQSVSYFIAREQIPIHAAGGEYQPLLIVLSFAVGLISAYIAIRALFQINLKNPKSRNHGCIAAAIIMGIGLWAMQFLAKLAYKMSMVHSYHLGISLFSMLVMMFCLWGVFRNLTVEPLSRQRLLLNGLLLGVGIATMHYIGMEAMLMEAGLYYIPNLFMLSLISTIVVSSAALFVLQIAAKNKAKRALFQWIGAIMLALAVACAHYIGMKAAVFIPNAASRFDPNQSSWFLVLFIISITGIVIASVSSSQKHTFTRRNFSVFAITLFVLPFGVALYLLIGDASQEIAATQKERVGVRYHQSLFDLVLAVERYREGLVARVNEEEIQARRAHVASRLRATDALFKDSQKLGVFISWTKTKSLLLSSLDAYDQKSEAEIIELIVGQNQNIENVLRHMKEVSSTSHLVLDSDIEPYYMIDVMVHRIPDVLRDLAEMRISVIQFTSDKTARPDIIQKKLYEFLGRLESHLASYRYSVAMVERHDLENISVKVEKEEQAASKLEALFVKMRQAEALTSDRQAFQKDHVATIKEITTAFELVYERYSEHLLWHLNKRLQDKMTYVSEILVSFLLTLAVVTAIFIFARRNLVHQEVLEAAARTKAILNTVVDGIITINAKGRIETFNPSAESIFGYYQNEMIGKSINLLMPEIEQKKHDGYLAKYKKKMLQKL